MTFSSSRIISISMMKLPIVLCGRLSLPEQPDRRLNKVSFVAGCDPYADFDLGMLKPMVRRDFVRHPM